MKSGCCAMPGRAAGFTLIEVMAALGLLAIVIAGMAPAFSSYLKQNYSVEIGTGALEAAQVKLDQLRALDPAALPSSGASAAENINAGSRTYSVVTYYCQTAAYCSSANTRHLRVEVSYRSRNVLGVETVYTKLR